MGSVADGSQHVLKPADLSWGPIQAFPGACPYYLSWLEAVADATTTSRHAFSLRWS